MPDLHRSKRSIGGIVTPSKSEGHLARIEALLKRQTELLVRQVDALERLITLEEERREGERQIEALAAALAGGGDAGELSDAALIDAHYRTRDGHWGINGPDGAQRAATDAESRRLEAMVGRRRRRS